MNTAYSKTVAFIILSGALLAQPRVQATEKMSDISSTASCVVAYCTNVRCWQQSPCLDHQADTEKLPFQKQRTNSHTTAFPSSIIVPRNLRTAARYSEDVRLWAPISSPTS